MASPRLSADQAARLVVRGRAKAAQSKSKTAGRSIDALKAAASKLAGSRAIDAAAFQHKVVQARSAIRSARARD